MHKGRERRDREIHPSIHLRSKKKKQKTLGLEESSKESFRERKKLSRDALIPGERSLPPIGDNIQAREMAKPEKWPRDRGSEIIRRDHTLVNT